MEDYLKSALEIVKAQATVRTMSAEEISNMISAVSGAIKGSESSIMGLAEELAAGAIVGGGLKSIREKSIVCLECGKKYTLISKKHLIKHGMTPEQYREKYGLKKGTPLVCKALIRQRRHNMKTLELWKTKGKKDESIVAVQ